MRQLAILLVHRLDVCVTKLKLPPLSTKSSMPRGYSKKLAVPVTSPAKRLKIKALLIAVAPIIFHGAFPGADQFVCQYWLLSVAVGSVAAAIGLNT